MLPVSVYLTGMSESVYVRSYVSFTHHVCHSHIYFFYCMLYVETKPRTKFQDLATKKGENMARNVTQ